MSKKVMMQNDKNEEKKARDKSDENNVSDSL